MARSLNPDEIARFHETGYLAVSQITTPEEVARIRASYDGLFEKKAGRDKGDFFDFAGTDGDDEVASLPQLLDPSRYEPSLVNTLFRSNAQLIARQLLGPTAELVFEHAMLKPALHGGETPWHQDEAFFPRFTNYRSITFWLPLQPVDEHNGCLDFIPGSHKMPILPHRSINNDPRIHGLEAQGVDDRKSISCPLPEGGATIHHYRTLHHAGPNHSGGPRRAYALGFGVRSDKYILRADFPWNLQRATAREKRAAESESSLQRCLRQLKNSIKAAVR